MPFNSHLIGVKKVYSYSSRSFEMWNGRKWYEFECMAVTTFDPSCIYNSCSGFCCVHRYYTGILQN